MNKLVLLVLMVFSGSAIAAGDKFAIVDTLKLFQQSPQTEAISEKINNEFKDKKDKLIALQKSAQDLEQKMIREKATMSLTQSQEMARKLEDQKRELQVESKRLQQDMTQRQKQEFVSFQNRVIKAIDEVAKANKVDLVFKKEALLYKSDDIIDITEKVQKKLK